MHGGRDWRCEEDRRAPSLRVREGSEVRRRDVRIVESCDELVEGGSGDSASLSHCATDTVRTGMVGVGETSLHLYRSPCTEWPT